MSIQISLCASAIRVKWWMQFLNSLLNNNTSFEVIFVGNVRPIHELPRNFKYIYSEKCPAQCYQIAFDNAQGELINWTADDVEYSQGALDIAYKYYKDFNNYKMVIAFNCIENGSPTSLGHRLYDENSPQMAPIGMMNSTLLKYLGGYDKRFICGQAENDLVMRVYENGGNLSLCQLANVYIEHDKKHQGKSIFRSEDGYDYHKKDREFLEKCWLLPNKTVSKTRLIEFEPFDNNKEKYE